MNKFDLINKVLSSDLQSEDKCLLIELIVRADDEGVCWPSVERLCKVRGIRHEKNFKGADSYLPGLVTKAKRGRKNVYTINTPAVEGLSEAPVTIKHTPAVEGVSTLAQTNTPAVEGVNTPAVAENTPAVAGANTTKNTTRDNTTTDAAAPVVIDSLNLQVREDAKVAKTVTASSNDRLQDRATNFIDPAVRAKFNKLDVVDALTKYSRYSQPAEPVWEQIKALALDPNFKPEVRTASVRVHAAASAVTPIDDSEGW